MLTCLEMKRRLPTPTLKGCGEEAVCRTPPSVTLGDGDLAPNLNLSACISPQKWRGKKTEWEIVNMGSEAPTAKRSRELGNGGNVSGKVLLRVRVLEGARPWQ